MAIINVPSGAKVDIKDSSTEEAFELYDEVTKILLERKLSLHDILMGYRNMILKKNEESDGTIYFSDILAIEGASEAFMLLTSSKIVRDKVFKTLLRCTYNDAKITQATFENNPKAKEDYQYIFFAALKENLAPFFSFLL
ncbi:MAG: hypothetical protein ACRC6O_13170 [Flavobacterium sp.]